MARRQNPSPSSPAADEGADSKSARTRARILDAAATALSRKGYSGLRLSDVAEVAQIQAPAIYYYFSSREDLIEEVMWVGIASMREHLDAVLDALPAETSPLDRILAAVEAHLRHELELSDYATAFIRNSGQIPDTMRKRQDAEEKKYGAVWNQLIRTAHAEGAIRQDLDLYVAQMLVLGSISWAAEWWNPRRGNLEKIVDNAQAFIRSSLAPA